MGSDGKPKIAQAIIVGTTVIGVSGAALAQQGPTSAADARSVRAATSPNLSPVIDPAVTSSSHIRFADVAHAFSNEDFEKAVDEKSQLIVAHDIPVSAEGYKCQLLHVEYRPILVPAAQQVTELTDEQVADVIKGKIKNWSDLGGRNETIRLYLNGSPLQRKNFESFAKRMGIPQEALDRPEVKFCDDYAAMEAAAKDDANAMVIGLKKPALAGFKLASVNGGDFGDNKSKYPFTENVYLLKRAEPAGEKTSQEFIQKVGATGVSVDEVARIHGQKK